jgi:hypothetical protein
MDPGLVAAAFGHGGNARVLFELFSGGVAVALFAKATRRRGAKTAPASGTALNNVCLGDGPHPRSWP